MSTAYQRVKELLDRWQASVELHSRYLALNDQEYARVQSWPPHARPTKWVVELARVRLEEMRRKVSRLERSGDESIAETLELMTFLTNLLGAQPSERFIPMATLAPKAAASSPARRLRAKAEPPPPAPASARLASVPIERPHPGPAPAAVPQRPATPRATDATPARAAAMPAPKAAPPAPASDEVTATIVADAVRFLNWGREWPALAPLIARLAGRPPEAEIVRILRAHRALIERTAREPRP